MAEEAVAARAAHYRGLFERERAAYLAKLRAERVEGDGPLVRKWAALLHAPHAAAHDRKYIAQLCLVRVVSQALRVDEPRRPAVFRERVAWTTTATTADRDDGDAAHDNDEQQQQATPLARTTSHLLPSLDLLGRGLLEDDLPVSVNSSVLGTSSAWLSPVSIDTSQLSRLPALLNGDGDGDSSWAARGASPAAVRRAHPVAPAAPAVTLTSEPSSHVRAPARPMPGLARPGSPPGWSSLMSGLTDVDTDDLTSLGNASSYAGRTPARPATPVQSASASLAQARHAKPPRADVDRDSDVRLSDGSTFASSSAARVHADDLRRFLERSVTGSEATTNTTTLGAAARPPARPATQPAPSRSASASTVTPAPSASVLSSSVTASAGLRRSTASTATVSTVTRPPQQQQQQRRRQRSAVLDDVSLSADDDDADDADGASVSSQTSFGSQSSLGRDFAALKARYRRIVATLES